MVSAFRQRTIRPGRAWNHWFSRLWLVLVLSAGRAPAARAAGVSARVAVESRDVYVGAPFALQIQVEGVTEVPPPDLSKLPGFKAEYRGASPNSSTQLSVINGRVSRVVSRSVILQYRLTALREGSLAVPAIELDVQGRAVRTQPITIRARKPGDTADAALTLQVSKKECYVGEALTLTWTLFMDERTRRVEFFVPLLDQPGFDFPEQDVPLDPSKRDRYRKIALGPDREVIGLLGSGVHKGKRYTTLTFELLMIPRTPGVLSLPRTTATCQLLAGYTRRTRRGPFDDPFFDGFSNPRRERYRTVVVAAPARELTVRELPIAGRPAGFSGSVGRFQVSTRAQPVVVNVGDPISLRILISGSTHLDAVECPPFDQQPEFSRNFRVSNEADPGEIQGNVKVFTRTVRAANPDVKRIPPVELVYFDTTPGRYATARSSPIALTVKATKVVTALDAEGAAPATPAAKALKAWSRGIAHNYEGPSVLVRQQSGLRTWLHSRLWRALLIAPPLLWCVLFIGLTAYRRRYADPAALAAKRAGPRCLSRLKRLDPASAEGHDLLLHILREYFGAKLTLPAGALTFADLEPHLKKRDLDPRILDALGRVFEACTAGRYAGGGEAVPVGELTETARNAVKTLEKQLK